MWVPGVTEWLSSLGRLLTQPFADIPVLAADLGFVPREGCFSPETPV